VAIYSVTIDSRPGIYEEVTLAADNPEEARTLAVASAVARMQKEVKITVTEVQPDPDP
jgi:hypothetical protein